MKKRIYLLFFVLIVVLIDQITKILINKYINLNESKIIIKNFFKFTNSHNYGAAYGILSGKTYFLILISIIVFIYLIKEINKSTNKYLNLFYSMIISGLIGNLIDRVIFGYVRDFISFSFFGYNAAIFNISDIFIFVGAMMMLLYYVRDEYERNKSK